MLSNTLGLNFCYLQITHILRSRYHLIIMGHILKNKQKNKCVCFHEIIRLIIMKMEMKMKNKSHRYDINRSRSRHGHKYCKFKKCLRVIILETQFTKKLSSTEAKLKKTVAYKKACTLKVLLQESILSFCILCGSMFLKIDCF